MKKQPAVPALYSRELVHNGSYTADCQKTFEELKAKGVEFVQEPTEQFYGIEAIFRDNSGN